MPKLDVNGIAKVTAEAVATERGKNALVQQVDARGVDGKESYVRVVVGDTTYEIDHQDSKGVTRTADEIAAIVKGLLS